MLNASVKNDYTQTVFNHLKQHGSHALAYHTLQSNLSHFVSEDGYLAYTPQNKSALVLGDPVCQRSKTPLVLDEFLKDWMRVSFVQISRTTASILSERGFKIFQIGIESEIKLPFSLKGKEKSDLRNSYNISSKNNIAVREFNKRSEVLEELPHSLNYRKEFSFLARRLESFDEKDVRVFGGYYRDELKYISLFDPMYNMGKVESYAEVISRRSIDAPKGIRVFVLVEAMRCFHDEGRRSVNLGLSPLYRNNQSSKIEFPNPLMDVFLNTIFNYGNALYNFKGLAFHKSRFKAEELPVYFASREKFPIFPLLDTYLLTTGTALSRYKT